MPLAATLQPPYVGLVFRATPATSEVRCPPFHLPTLAYVGPSCTPTARCNQVWAWPVIFLCCIVFTLAMLAIVFTQKSRPETSWLLPTLSFFFQNVPLLYAQAGPNWLGKAIPFF